VKKKEFLNGYNQMIQIMDEYYKKSLKNLPIKGLSLVLIDISHVENF